MDRLNIEEYGCLLTLIGKARSEDVFTQCCAVGINKNKRILGISYNGLKSGMLVPEWMKLEENRTLKSKYYLHAEQNLFNLIKNEECDLLCINYSPCFNCSKIIIANNVKKVIYLKEYSKCSKFKELFNFYGIQYQELSIESKNKIKKYLYNINNFSELNV